MGDKYLESVKERNNAEFIAKLNSKNSDVFNLQRIENVLEKNNYQATYTQLKTETNLADKSLQDALELGKSQGLLKKPVGSNLYYWFESGKFPYNEALQATLSNWDARRLFLYKVLISKKIQKTYKAEYIAPYIEYLKIRATKSKLIGDKLQAQQDEVWANNYIALAKEYGFDKELDDVFKKNIRPNDIQQAKNINKKMLGIYEKQTAPSQLRYDLCLTQELVDRIKAKKDTSDLENQI